MRANVQPRNLYGFLYYPLESQLRPDTRPMYTQAHRVRDDHVILGSMSTLGPLGYRFAGAIVNVAPSILGTLAPREKRALEPPLVRKDLIYFPSRPALDDKPATGGPRRYIQRSNTPLEKEIFAALRSVLGYCNRESVLLAISLPEDARQFEQVYFRENKGGRVRKHGPHKRPRRAPQDPRLGVGYLISIPSVGETGFRLLNVFGPGGVETFVMGQLLEDFLEDRLRDLVLSSQTRLVIVSFRVPDYLPYPYLRYDTADLAPRIVADVSLGPDAMAM